MHNIHESNGRVMIPGRVKQIREASVMIEDWTLIMEYTQNKECVLNQLLVFVVLKEQYTAFKGSGVKYGKYA